MVFSHVKAVEGMVHSLWHDRERRVTGRCVRLQVAVMVALIRVTQAVTSLLQEGAVT